MNDHKNPIILLLMITLCIAVTTVTTERQTVHAFSPQVIQHGAVGEDVIELQSRLKYIGFYTGPIDGIFGWRTYWALRNFQYEFGLEIDGLAGQTTKNKLVKATKFDRNSVQTEQEKSQGSNQSNKAPEKGNTGNTTSINQTPQGYSQNDIDLMANAVHGEARGEPYEGQVAVAAVILNRVNSPTFPNTIAGVIFEPRAFTAVADGQIYLTPNETSKKAVLDAINGWDPTGNATYYFNPDTATSAWIWTRPQIKQIGKHIFCK
ncbi:spore cortex-lytic enzyme [Ornithinibacillus gellani]|uniref:spore cortex-lytic enzyme n=1 Tax=Ornithinibacillus gellani TaxID=2293253 RepID=UPI000F4AE0B0|nr:spore cortex-lytic enzyme [Ornithinibacillus gellani]TQS74431.1 spore cortex-lytic enzyme [Ornithinibacillus gellani]